jgi:hypothetical protein
MPWEATESPRFVPSSIASRPLMRKRCARHDLMSDPRASGQRARRHATGERGKREYAVGAPAEPKTACFALSLEILTSWLWLCWVRCKRPCMRSRRDDIGGGHRGKDWTSQKPDALQHSKLSDNTGIISVPRRLNLNRLKLGSAYMTRYRSHHEMTGCMAYFVVLPRGSVTKTWKPCCVFQVDRGD